MTHLALNRPILLLAMLAASLPLSRPVSAQDAGRGAQLFDAREYDAARAEFRARVARNDRDAQAHYYLGRLDLIASEPDAAADHLAHAVKLADGVSDYHLWYGNAMGQQAIEAGKFRQAILARRVKTEFERAVALDPRSIMAREGLVDFYSIAPGFLGGSPEKARQQVAEIAKLDRMRGHVAAARLAIRAKDKPEVERQYQAAIVAAPDSLRPYTGLSSWYANEKRWDDAFAVVDRYMKGHPADPWGPYAVGRYAILSGQRMAEGERGIRAFIAHPPADAAGPASMSRAWMRLGYLLAKQGRTAESRAAFEQAVKLDPRNTEARKQLG